MSGSGEYYPALISLSIILVLGFVFPLIISPFVDVESIVPSGILENLITFVSDGITFTLPIIGEFTLNFFDLFGETFKGYLVDNLTYMSLIPSIILIPLTIFIFFGFGYTIFRLARG